MTGGWGTLLVVVLGVLTGCGGGDALGDDPRGTDACRALVQALDAGDQFEVADDRLTEAGEAASEAKTDAIRGSVLDQADVGTAAAVDLAALRDACETNGFDIPDPS